MKNNVWIGVDLDGTLAEQHEWSSLKVIGDPINSMIDRVNEWLDDGIIVKIVTARVNQGNETDNFIARQYIYKWLKDNNLARIQEIVCCKDMNMIALWDNKCVQVETNTGRIIGELK